MFYAYPLKFLASFLWRLILGESIDDMFVVPAGVDWSSDDFQRAGMMYFFSLGVVGVFAVLASMEFRAYRCRKELDLDELERFLTRASIRSHLLTVSIACTSMLVLRFGGEPGWAGVTYFLMWPVHMIDGILTGTWAEQISQRIAADQGHTGER